MRSGNYCQECQKEVAKITGSQILHMSKLDKCTLYNDVRSSLFFIFAIT